VATEKSAAISQHLHLRELPDTDYAPGELGAVHRKRPEDIVAALQLIQRGEIYDLESGRWPGMPLFAAHPPFIVSSYRSPRGMRNQRDLAGWTGANTVNMAMNTEIVIGTTHTGTHLDALSHITCGPDSHWHGGYTEADDVGDFGPLTAEASSIPPFICRGVLVDIPGLKGVDLLDGQTLIGLDDTRAALERQGVEVRDGDAVFFRTGYMQVWDGEPQLAEAHMGAGIGHDVAVWLGEQGVVLVGGDTETLERNPSPDPENPHPVHIELLIRRGIHIMELVHLEDLARDGVYEFTLICLPLRIRGATASMVRPIAVV
jgi:kynurenine formamidase